MVGGGTAGAEAAREAARGGAQVTLVERSERHDPPWRCWPDLIGSPQGAGGSKAAVRVFEAPEETILAGEVKSAGRNVATMTDGVTIRFDSVVVATGCGFEPTGFPGHRKPGVLILDCADRYAELGRVRSCIEGCVVNGEGMRALQVAERLSGSGRSVRLFISSWQQEEPSPPVYRVLEQAAEERGVSIANGTVSKAVGSDSLEAVVIGGEVFPCNAFASVPRRTPRVIPMRAQVGEGGAFVVDRNLRTSAAGAYAAGGSAELGAGFLPSANLGCDAAMSGRIAGANAAGSRFSIGVVRSTEAEMFGVRWVRVGIGFSSARAYGLLVGAVSHRWSATSGCSIVYERATGRVVGVEFVEEAGVTPTEIPLLAAAPVSLKTLAYGGLGGSSDISLVSDTARLGFRSWSKS